MKNIYKYVGRKGKNKKINESQSAHFWFGEFKVMVKVTLN